MASLVNFTKHLKKKNLQQSFSHSFYKKKNKGGNMHKVILWGQHYSDSKTRKKALLEKKTTGQYPWWI